MKEKSVVYTAVFYISVLITVILILVMLFAPQDSDGDAPQEIIPDIGQGSNEKIQKDVVPTFTTGAVTERSVEITEGELSGILDKVLFNAVGIHVKSIIITSDYVCISAEADKLTMVERIENLGAKIGKAADIAIKLAPDTIDADVELQLTTHKETQEIQANIKKLSLLGFKVPVELLPQGFDKAIGEYLDSVRDEYGLSDLKITLRNGKLILSGF